MLVYLKAKDLRESPKEVPGEPYLGNCHYPSALYEKVSRLTFAGTFMKRDVLESLAENPSFNDIEERAIVVFETKGEGVASDDPSIRLINTSELADYVKLSDNCHKAIGAGLCARGTCCRGVYEWIGKTEAETVASNLGLKESDFIQYWEGGYGSIKHIKGSCSLLEKAGSCQIQPFKNLWCSYFICPKMVKVAKDKK
jgi:hypothetical protein